MDSRTAWTKPRGADGASELVQRRRIWRAEGALPLPGDDREKSFGVLVIKSRSRA